MIPDKSASDVREPCRWAIEYFGQELLTTDRSVVKFYADSGCKVTPLYASPAPQGGERELTFVHALAADFENSVHHVWDNQEVADRIRQFSSDLIAAFPLPAATGWQPIETAPKDGTSILLLSKEHTHPADMNGGPYHHPPKCAIGRWHAEGTSWCDENGRFPDDPEVDDDSINLHVTGVWFSGGGWFQPNEVTHWQPLPAPPALTDKRPPLKQEDGTSSTVASTDETAADDRLYLGLKFPSTERQDG